MSHKPGTQDAHEAGEYQQIDADIIASRCNGSVEKLAIVEVAMRNTAACDAGVAGTFETIGICTIADNDGNLQLQFAALNVVYEGLQVAA